MEETAINSNTRSVLSFDDRITIELPLNINNAYIHYSSLFVFFSSKGFESVPM